MRWILSAILFLCLASTLPATETPLVQQYLESGQLAKGEQVLELALAASPKDDQIRFSLGLLQIFRGVERLGQGLYEYGCRSENSYTPFLRIPVPKNPDPTPVTYTAIRRVFEGFHSDLAAAERTLAAITDRDVKLPLRLAGVTMDLDNDGVANDKLIDILKKLMGPSFKFPDTNPDFLVGLDRGDVAWLRAYCHLLMGLLDGQLALDLEDDFYQASDVFERPKKPHVVEKPQATPRVIAIKDPARLGRFRLHVLAVCDLNHETWMFIRNERDDDHEWLPNSKQKGALGLPVNDAMIDAWLGMIDETKALFDGTKVIPNWILNFISQEVPARAQLNMKTLFDDPPAQLDHEKVRRDGINAKYLVYDGKEANIEKFLRVGQVFQNTFSVGYAAWFN